MVLADRGYDASWIGALVNEQGAWANIAPKRSRRQPILTSVARNRVERFFNKIKHCRRIATPYDKLAVNLPGVCLGGC
jgi:transposase